MEALCRLPSYRNLWLKDHNQLCFHSRRSLVLLFHFWPHHDFRRFCYLLSDLWNLLEPLEHQDNNDVHDLHDWNTEWLEDLWNDSHLLDRDLDLCGRIYNFGEGRVGYRIELHVYLQEQE